MMIQGSNPYGAAMATPAARQNMPVSGSPEQDFMNYMKQTPAQRMEDAWLAAHHLSRADLDKMTPVQRAAVQREMAEDLKRQALQRADKTGAPDKKLDVLA